MQTRLHCYFFISIIAGLVFISSCHQKTSVWRGQAPIRIVPTETVPIQLQLKKHFDVGGGIVVSNTFEGARMNGVSLTKDTLLTVLISPENAPINPSPWYAFSVVAPEEQTLTLKLTYSPGSFHRYYPKVSRDGKNWTNFDSVAYSLVIPEDSTARPIAALLRLTLSPDTLWIAAQESIGTHPIREWTDRLAEKPHIKKQVIGQSHEGRDLDLLRIGNPNSKKLLMIMGLQHPPEIPGFMAMQAFVETMAGDSELARRFRDIP